MIFYKKHKRSWSIIIGWIIFLVVLGITFADLYGGKL